MRMATLIAGAFAARVPKAFQCLLKKTVVSAELGISS